VICGFLRVLWFPPSIKLTLYNITEILLKVALNAINLNLICSALIQVSDYRLLGASGFYLIILRLILCVHSHK
jgi:ABC-type uncharacterized transport system permease subunit